MEFATGPHTPICKADATTLALWLNLALAKGCHEPMEAAEVKRLKTALARFLNQSGVMYDLPKGKRHPEIDRDL